MSSTELVIPPPPERTPHFVESCLLSIPNISSLLIEYYNLLIRIAYFDATEIAFPPHSNIDMDMCERFHLTPEVVEVMKSIPYPVNYDTALLKPIVQSSRAFVMTDPEDILASRDPNSMMREIGEEFNPEFLQPWEIALNGRICIDCDYWPYILILDTRAGTMRRWGDNEPPGHIRGDLPYPRPEDQYHYLNVPTRPAEEVLTELVEDLQLLEQIPLAQDGSYGRYSRRGHRDWPLVMAKLLELGWLGEEWRKDEYERIKNELYDGIEDYRSVSQQQERDRGNGGQSIIIAGMSSLELEQ